MHSGNIENYNFIHGLHRNLINGKWFPLHPHTLGRPLTHDEMDYNLLYSQQTVAGWRIFGQNDNLTLSDNELKKSLIFWKISADDVDYARYVAAGYTVDQYIWITPTPAPEPTATEVPPTATPEPTAVEPTATPEPTAVEPTATPEPTAVEPTATPEPTAVEPTPTPEPTGITGLQFHLGIEGYPYAQDLIEGTLYKSDNSVAADFPDLLGDMLANPGAYEPVNTVPSWIPGNTTFTMAASAGANFYWLVIPTSAGVPDLTTNAKISIDGAPDDIASAKLDFDFEGNQYTLYKLNTVPTTPSINIAYN